LLIGGLAVAVVGLLVAVLVLALDNDDSSPPTVVVGKSTAESQDSDTQTDTVDAEDSPEPKDLAETSGEVDQPKFFETPSGNIHCGLSPEGVRCDIDDRDWSPATPKPASCNLDWGNGVSMGSEEPVTFTCAGDTLLGSSEGKLDYGYMVRRGHIRCISQEDGLTCERTDGAGFFLSKEEVRFF
jgi:hypothetical protein